MLIWHRCCLYRCYSIIWRKINKFDFKVGNVYSWLETLARNKAIDNLRKFRFANNSTVQLYDDEYEDYFILPTFPKDIVSLDYKTVITIKPKIEKALSKLTDTQKYVLHLAYYEGYTIDEISNKLNVPLETVRNKIMNSLHNLKDYLNGE